MMENQTKKEQNGEAIEIEENARRKQRILEINKVKNIILEKVKHLSD